MPTPMHVFNEIAARYGVNPHDPKSVQHFFRKTLASLSDEEKQKILDELLARDGETDLPSTSTPTTIPPSNKYEIK